MDMPQGRLSYSPKEIILDPPQELLQCTDLNGDGVIDYEEFLGATVRMGGGPFL